MTAPRLTGVDALELAALGALWGASFLFMRLGAADFGPAALVFLRVAGAALLLLPLLVWRGEVAALRAHWRPIAVIGVLNSALPFALFAVAALVLPAGLSGLFNAAAPLWAAVFAALWLGERPGVLRGAGLAVAFAGVAALGWAKSGGPSGAHGLSAASGVVACLAATACYGGAALYTRLRLQGVPAVAVAAGSQAAAAVLTLAPALAWWPAQPVPPLAWASAAGLAFACTGLAYVMYFRLIGRIGAGNAITVTFLVPLFALAWGALLLGERPTPAMLLGGAVILAGTALATGVLPRLRRAAAQNASSV